MKRLILVLLVCLLGPSVAHATTTLAGEHIPTVCPSPTTQTVSSGSWSSASTYIHFTVGATDDVGVTYVALKINGQTVREGTAPQTWSIRRGAFSSGAGWVWPLQAQGIARDAAGNEDGSTIVVIE